MRQRQRRALRNRRREPWLARRQRRRRVLGNKQPWPRGLFLRKPGHDRRLGLKGRLRTRRLRECRHRRDQGGNGKRLADEVATSSRRATPPFVPVPAAMKSHKKPSALSIRLIIKTLWAIKQLTDVNSSHLFCRAWHSIMNLERRAIEQRNCSKSILAHELD